MKLHWYDSRVYQGQYAICGHTTSSAPAAQKLDSITCKWCLRKVSKLDDLDDLEGMD